MPNITSTAIQEPGMNIKAKAFTEKNRVPYRTNGALSGPIATVNPSSATPHARLRRLRELLDSRPIVRILEVHSGLCGLIVEALTLDVDGERREFDGMWSSSLTDSTVRGKPDIEVVDLTARQQTLHDIFEVTTKPLIYDADTGGRPEHFAFTVRSLERHGASAVIIEDKTGLKKNSLFGTEVFQQQETIENFTHKLRMGKAAQVTPDFMVIARIESLILGQGLDDALQRAEAYCEAGADAIMIHSRDKEPAEIVAFCQHFHGQHPQVPIVAVPSSYNSITEQELIDLGVRIVIYANHMLRSAYPAMVETATSILRHGRAQEAEAHCMPISHILDLIPGTR